MLVKSIGLGPQLQQLNYVTMDVSNSWYILMIMLIICMYIQVADIVLCNKLIDTFSQYQFASFLPSVSNLNKSNKR